MCNINLILNKRKTDSFRLSEYMTTVSYNSWKTNNDGEGFIGLGKKGLEIKKGTTKMRYTKPYWFLVSHQRIKTSGKINIDNTHPHITKNLVLLHNGIFSYLGNEKKSDTKIYIERLDRKYNQKQKELIKAIQTLNRKVSGSYSIVIYEKKSKKVYYYKESLTDMYILENKNWLIMSTTKENLEFAKYFFDINAKIREIKPYKIYDIFNGFKEIGTFREKRIYITANEKGEKNKYWYDDINKKSWENYKGNKLISLNNSVNCYKDGMHWNSKKGYFEIDEGVNKDYKSNEYKNKDYKDDWENSDWSDEDWAKELQRRKREKN